MEDRLPVIVESEDGERYFVSLWTPDSMELQQVWAQYSKYRVLFSDITVNDFKTFFDMVMSRACVVFAIDTVDTDPIMRVGLLYATEIRLGSSALGHYVFWDRKTAGRQCLILEMLRLGMQELGLHRMNVTIPMYAYSALRRVSRMGFRIEGRRREAILHQGKWHDVLEFGTLLTELTDEACQRGWIQRDDSAWQYFVPEQELLKVIKRGIDEWTNRARHQPARPALAIAQADT